MYTYMGCIVFTTHIVLTTTFLLFFCTVFFVFFYNFLQFYTIFYMFLEPFTVFCMKSTSLTNTTHVLINICLHMLLVVLTFNLFWKIGFCTGIDSRTQVRAQQVFAVFLSLRKESQLGLGGPSILNTLLLLCEGSRGKRKFIYHRMNFKVNSSP